MALILTDLTGNEYPVHAVTNHSEKMSADGMLTFSVMETKENTSFINDISKLWRVSNVKGDNDRQRYVVVITSRKAVKDKQVVEVTAKEEQFDYLETHRVYEDVTGSYPAVSYLNLIFDNTPYDYVLLDNASALEWENSGNGMAKMDMFKKWLTRYGFEFKFDPNINRFTLGRHIARQPAYVLSKKINANDLNIEEDATNFYTYRRGYGNYEGEDNMHEAKLERSYTSPLSKIAGIGIREMEPLTDGRIKDKDLMDEKLFESIEDSLKMTVTFDFVRLGHNYPYAQPEIGDEIPVIDTTIQFNRLMRIIEIKTTRDAQHKIIKQSVTVGDPNRITRYQAKSNGAFSDLNDLLSGRTQLRESVLPAAIKRATDMLTETASELTFSEKGIIAVDKDNPNYLTLFNSSGLGVSSDGGQTFRNAITRGEINADLITAGSINADYIRSGQLDANLVNVVSNDGHIIINGSEMQLIGITNDSRTHLRPDGLRIRRPDGVWATIDGVPKHSLAMQRNQFMHPDVSFSGQNYSTKSEFYVTYENFYAFHDARYLVVAFGANIHPSSKLDKLEVSAQCVEFGRDNSNRNGSVTMTVTKTSGTVHESITIDLGAPTYEPMSFYLNFKVSNGKDSNAGLIRTNRVHMKG
ncbi:phage tail protein [Mammaliicoccus sciuri]|uniref:tail tube TT1 domain-containing protein n=1 Tax=Mammaliicoccus sciuri TaxID=1296 RepID=UPI001F45538F|nr:phage tail protein [Mammaliicoccus sciuri]MCE5058165.1 phage tail protein [Mammaliicoccus sciuri]